MKYVLAQTILDRILTDNDFSLRMSLHMNIRQDSLFRLVKRNSNSLNLPEQVAFYKEEGYEEDKIFEIIETEE